METSENPTPFSQTDENYFVNSAFLIEKGKSLYRQGKLNEALNFFQEASNVLSHLPRDLIEVNLLLSMIHMQQDQADASIKILDQSLEICQTNFEKDDPITARVYNALSRANKSKKKYETAYQQALKALKLSEMKLSSKDIEIGRCYHNIGSCLRLLSRYEEAKIWLEKALEIKEMYNGEDRDLELGLTFQSLGNLYSMIGEDTEAAEYLEKSLKFMKTYYNCNHPDILILYDNLAGLYTYVNQLNKAEDYYKLLLELSLSLNGEYHSRSARTYKGLGDIYYKVHQFSAAEDNFLRALKIFDKLFGKDYIEIGTTYVALATLKFSQYKFTQALKYIFQALQIYEKNLLTRHSSTQKALAHLEEFLTSLRFYEEALKPSLKVIVLRRKSYGTNHFYYLAQIADIKSIQLKIDLYKTDKELFSV